MCGRYALAADPEELVEAFGVPPLPFAYVRRYNVAPGQRAPVVAEDRRGRRMGLLTWGFAPNRMDDPGSGFVNARCESVREKPSFRDAFARRRCLVPADGFYEWKRDGRGKTPYWLHPAAGGVVALAGIWERWSRPGAAVRHTFAILTTDANEDVRAVHDRMPVVIHASQYGPWLDRGTDLRALERLLRPAPRGTFLGHAVSARVNRPTDDDAGLIDPVER